MTSRTLIGAAAGSLMASIAFAPGAHATGDIWLEGSYEFLSLPNVQFINNYFIDGGGNGTSRDEFVNDDGDFNGFRFDGGIADIPVMGGAYFVGLRGFFAWHDDKSDIQCSTGTAFPFESCFAVPLADPTPATLNYSGGSAGATDLFTTERDVNHWGIAIDVARGPMGLKAGPAFRRIDQKISVTGREVNNAGVADPYELTYSESLETNYWGGFIGADGAVDLGGGWSLQGDAEAGLYWADTDYSGRYLVTNASVIAPFNPNLDQRLSLDSNELAFIGSLKGSLEKDFGWFKLAGFGRVEYISSAPDVAYNDLDRGPAGRFVQGADDETRLGERFAYSLSTGARITVPMGPAR